VVVALEQKEALDQEKASSNRSKEINKQLIDPKQQVPTMTDVSSKIEAATAQVSFPESLAFSFFF
jgi:hypothetical protein